jgi:hypothetical protein
MTIFHANPNAFLQNRTLDLYSARQVLKMLSVYTTGARYEGEDVVRIYYRSSL